MKKPVKVLIADDHKIVREGIKLMLNSHEKIDFKIYEVENGESVLPAYKKIKVDLVLMDINMKKMSGIDATKSLLKYDSNAKVLALSMHNDDYIVKKMISAGASGYLLKDAGIEEIIKAINTVLEGSNYYSNDIALKLINSFNDKKEVKIEFDSTSKISKRELEVLTLIANQHTNDEVANLLGVSKRTVDSHRHNMLMKLGLKNTAGLVHYAVKNSLVD